MTGRPRTSTLVVIGLFLGVLELTKQRSIIPEQGEPFAEIWVALAPPPVLSAEPSEATQPA